MIFRGNIRIEFEESEKDGSIVGLKVHGTKTEDIEFKVEGHVIILKDGPETLTLLATDDGERVFLEKNLVAKKKDGVVEFKIRKTFKDK